MADADQRTVALALQARDRHGVNVDDTCRHCLPPGTPWPCVPFQLATQTIERLAYARRAGHERRR